MAGPLDGVKVLDLTRVLAGPYATMVMSDLGAEVIKVERPEGGDMARGTGPFIDGQSSYFMSINRGKKSVILDFKDEGDKQTFLELLDHFDVLVENFVPGVMKRLGLDYEVLEQAPSEANICSGLGVRAVGALHETPGTRHNSSGDGRDHEHHRRARAPASQAWLLARRHHCRSLHHHRNPVRPPRT